MEENVQNPAEKKARPPLGGLVLLMIFPLIGGIVGYFGAALVTYVLPKKYESVTLLQVHPSGREMSPFVGSVPSGAGMGSRSFETELWVITADQTLARVVEMLNLTARWQMPPDTAVSILHACVVAEPLEGTELVEIRVRHTNAADARDIAGKVAEAYKERRTSMEMDRARQVLSALDAEVRNQEDLVEEKWRVLVTVAKAMGIPYQEGVEGNSRSTREEEGLRRAEQRLFELKTEEIRLKTEYGELRKLNSDGLLDYVRHLNTAPADDLRELRRVCRIEAQVLGALEESGVPDGDEELVRQRAKVEVLQKELEIAGGRYREGMMVKLNVAEKRVEAMREEVRAQRDQAVEASISSDDFVEAKREYEQARAMLTSMKQQLSAQRIALKIPREPITIHATPRRAPMPVSPVVEAYLTTGVVLGAAVGLILAIVIGLLRGMTNPTEPTEDDEWA